MTKGDKIRFNGDMWVVVDVAPAWELAEMVRIMLEEEGFIAHTTSGSYNLDGFQTTLGVGGIGTSYVIVPEEGAQEALAFVEVNVEDFTGEDAEKLLGQIALETPEEGLDA